MNTPDCEIVQSPADLGKVLLVKGTWRPAMLDVLKKKRIKCLRLSSLVAWKDKGWNDKDVSFLKSCGFLTSLEIITEQSLDLGLVGGLAKLRKLCLDCQSKTPVSFKQLPHLESLSVQWCPNYEDIFEHKGIRNLMILGYPFADLSKISSNRSLEQLTLYSKALERLQGIGEIKKLTNLELRECRRLTDLNDIAGAKNLRSVLFDLCPKISDIAHIGSLSKLEELYLANCRGIVSLKPLARCRNLHTLQASGSTQILDGDFSPLLGLPKLGRVLIRHRKYYSHRGKELAKGRSLDV